MTFSDKRSYLAVVIGQIISSVGSGLTVFAMQWEVWTRYESGPSLAILWVIMAIPYVLLGPVAGTFVDRWNRRATIMWADFVGLLVVAAAAVSISFGALSLALVYGLILTLSVTRVVHSPALYASIPQLVPNRQLTRANSVLEFGRSGSRILGPMVGGALFALGWKVYGLLMLDVATYTAAIVLTFVARIPSPLTPKQENTQSMGKLSIWSAVARGFHYLWSEKELLWLLILTAVANLFSAGLNVLLPQIVTDKFHAGPELFGIFEAAIGAGGVGGSLLLLIWGGPKRRGLGIVGALGFGAMFQVAAGVANAPYLVAVSLGCAVVAWMIADTLGTTLYQEVVPTSMQGRVLALRRSLEQLTWPVSSLLAGVVSPMFLRADHFLAFGGFVSLLVVILVASLMSRRRPATRAAIKSTSTN